MRPVHARRHPKAVLREPGVEGRVLDALIRLSPPDRRLSQVRTSSYASTRLPSRRRSGRRLLIAAVLTLAVALAGELVELSPLAHLLCLAVTVLALAAVALTAPLIAAGDPPVDPGAHPDSGPGPGV